MNIYKKKIKINNYSGISIYKKFKCIIDLNERLFYNLTQCKLFLQILVNEEETSEIYAEKKQL